MIYVNPGSVASFHHHNIIKDTSEKTQHFISHCDRDGRSFGCVRFNVLTSNIHACYDPKGLWFNIRLDHGSEIKDYIDRLEGYIKAKDMTGAVFKSAIRDSCIECIPNALFTMKESAVSHVYITLVFTHIIRHTNQTHRLHINIEAIEAIEAIEDGENDSLAKV